MLNALVTAELPSTSGFAKDSVINAFSFTLGGGFVPGDIAELTTPILNFYNVQGAGAGSSVAEYLASNRKRTADAVIFRLYDVEDHLDGSPHGSPVATTTGTLRAAFAAAPLPSECAVAVTLRSTGWSTAAVEAPDGPDAGSAIDRPRQRRTGRIYLGPLDARAINAAGGFARVEANFRTAILAAADALQGAVNTSGHNWTVWSRVDSAMHSITDVQVDNAFDVQRRRGEAATVRDTVAV